MKFKIIGDSLIYIDEGCTIVNGENEFDIIEIEAPRYRNWLDCMSMSFRLTATSVEDSSITAVQVLAKQELDDKKILLSGSVTADFSSIEGKVLFMVTGTSTSGITAIFKGSRPIAIESNASLDSLPDRTAAEQLFNQAQLEVQKALNAENAINEAQREINRTVLRAYEIQGQIEDVQTEINISAHEAGTAYINAAAALQSAEEISQEAYEVINGLNENAADLLDGHANVKAEINDIKGYIGYTDNDIIGLHADFENCVFTRLAGAAGKNAGNDFDTFSMYGGRRRCNVLDDGTITAYYGDDNYVENGSNGQVMVYQPKFYYKVVPLKLEPITDGIGYHLRKANYYISETPKAGFKLHPAFYGENGKPVDYILFSAYEGSIFDVSANTYLANDEQIADFNTDRLSSVAGVKPCSGKTQNLNRANSEKLAQNRGMGWHIDDLKSFSASQLLIAIEYAGFNLQSEISRGAVDISDDGIHNLSSLTGATSDLGCISGITSEYSIISYRGTENPWGNIWKFVNGITICGNGLQRGGIPYICDNYNFSESNTDDCKSANFTITNANGFISAIGYSSECDWTFLPSETQGNSSLPIGDYVWLTSDLNGNKIPLTCGYWAGGSGVGYFCLNLVYEQTVHYRYIGNRLIYIP